MSPKVAVVVGAATGFGHASAIRLAAEGASLVIVDDFTDGLEQTRRQILERGGEVRAFEADPASSSDLTAVAEALAIETPAIHVLVNQHNKVDWGTFEECDVDEFAKVVHYNLVGPVASTKAFLPLLKEAGGSSVIHIGSVDGIYGNPLIVSYSAAKGGLIPMTNIMAREFAPFDIRVNTVAACQTNQVRAEDVAAGFYRDAAAGINDTRDDSPSRSPRFPGGWYMEQLSKATPLKRSGTPEEWAGTVAFLASDDASYVTGSVFVVDAGRTGLTPGTFPWDSDSTV